MILFAIIQELLVFAKPLDMTKLNEIYHKQQVKHVPLKKFTIYSKPLPFIPDDVKNIKQISLQPTLESTSNKYAYNLICDQHRHLRGRKTIVLDLDETLFSVDEVRSWNGGPNDSALRPFHKSFIKACKDNFEVVVWTRSGHSYAEKKCEWLGLDGLPMISGWGDCDKIGAKPLYKLNREDSQILLIDDDKVHLTANPRSQLLIPPWYGDVNDRELLSAIHIINKIAKEPTVQESLDIYLAQSYIYVPIIEKPVKK